MKGFPWEDLHKIFCACQWMARVPNAVEILQKITTVLVGRTSVTDDRQTERQTDGRDQSVSVLRNTGCSTVVVKRKLVDDEQMTGGTEACILIDGTVRRMPVVEIEIKTPYYTGKVKAVCMESPLYDVIIGKVPGVNDENNNRLEVQTVVTRAQAKHEVKPTKPLKVIENLGEDVTREKLIRLQGQDPSLTKFMKEAEQNQKAGRSEVYVKMKDGILYRYCRNFEGREISQVVIPKGLRETVMTMAMMQ